MEKKYKIGMDVAIAVTALGFLANLISIVFSPKFNLIPIIDTLLFIFVGYYAVWGYKKPHGNLLRYVMLVSTFSLAIDMIWEMPQDNKAMVLAVIGMCLTTYVAGRLNKIHKNKYIMVLILLIHLYPAVATIAGMGNFPQPENNQFLKFVLPITSFSRAFLWTAICSAYFTRFLQHKEAGLED